MRLDLNEKERELLLRLIETAVGDARVELRRTETSDWRDHVHEQEKLLKDLLVKLQALHESNSVTSL